MKLARFPPLSRALPVSTVDLSGDHGPVYLTLILFIAVHGHFTHNDLLNDHDKYAPNLCDRSGGNRATLVGNAMPAAGNTATEF